MEIIPESHLIQIIFADDNTLFPGSMRKDLLYAQQYIFQGGHPGEKTGRLKYHRSVGSRTGDLHTIENYAAFGDRIQSRYHR